MKCLLPVWVLVSCWCVHFLAPGSAAADRVNFNRDIRPILNDVCLHCHGPSQANREAGLRFDKDQGPFAKLESGNVPIVPGNSANSELYRRISSTDEDERMPPADHDRKLTKEQIAKIKQWIDEGAAWQKHWSFVPPQRPPLPEVKDKSWPANPIDRFVLARLEREGLQPSAEAARTALVRRVTYDLTGLPPTLEEIDAFLADTSPEAYEKLVDRLLASPRYGEHMARYWLDAARYGDTHGLHLDNERSLWPYREWVIEALNKNLPFDQFTKQQIGGDLLPDATLDQKIATGFNRCNVTTSEGGSIDEEYIVRYAGDRVETMGTVWMGLTLNCASCHDHKYDPISQQDYYQLFAFYNSLTERAMDGNAVLPPPFVRVPTREFERRQQSLRGQLAAVEKQIAEELAKVEYQEPAAAVEKPTGPREIVWIDDDVPAGAKAGAEGPPWQFVGQPAPVLSGKKSSTRKTTGRSQHYFTDADPGLRIGEGDKLFAHVYLDPQDPPQQIMLQWNDGAWEHRAVWGEDLIAWGQPGTASRLPMGKLPEAGRWVRLEVEAAKVGLARGALVRGWAFTQFGGTVWWDKAGIVTSTPQDGSQFESLAAWERIERAAQKSSLPADVRAAVLVDASKRDDARKKLVREYFLRHVYTKTRIVFDPLHRQTSDLNKQLTGLEKSMPGTMVMEEMAQPRDAFVLVRGAYDKRGEKVQRDVPRALGTMPQDAPRNRLGLAAWLVDRGNPLTARVAVNSYWQRYFGTGIVKTAEDFGTQGEWPSHPGLLDWLAVEFIHSGWDVKHLHKLIVTSATYRQSSRTTPEMVQRDRENRLLSRGPRFRMDAEMVRDGALAVSGLLVERIGGRSVKPYQPAGLWRVVGYTSSNTARFVQDTGDALYRRSMYTFWKRTSPPPSMTVLDAPSRENCSVRRERTNTPLAALTLMNDVQFVEAARHLAQRMMHHAEKPDERITFAFRLATARRPDAEELATIRGLYDAQLAVFQKDQGAAIKLVTVGDSPRDEKLAAGELAAWTMVANLILNLDETITKY